MEHLNGNLFFYTLDTTNKTILAVVTSTQLIKCEIPYLIEGIINVQGFYLVYGQTYISLFQITNDNNLAAISLNFTQQLTDIGIRSMVYYTEKNIFLSGHENGDLIAWSPGNNSLNQLGTIKISTSSILKLKLFTNFLLTASKDGIFQVFNIDLDFKSIFTSPSLGNVSIHN